MTKGNIKISEDNFTKLISKWNEPWRYYHNEDHLNFLLNSIEDLDISNNDKDILFEVAYFHDVVYNPWSDTNEEDSVKFYTKVTDDPNQRVIDIIMDTKLRDKPDDNLSSIFWELDNSVLKSDIGGLLEYERKIFKEFQFVNYSLYKVGRVLFLESCIGKFDNDENLKFLINYIKNYRPKIGFYPGSFNPLHIGHENIIEKCEKIFDKVIVGIGVNLSKGSSTDVESVRNSLNGRELIEYGKGVLTTKTMEKLSEDADITLIRGIRNSTDLSYENEKLRWMEKLSGEPVKVIYVPSDVEYDYISSSSIRKLIDGGFTEEVSKFLPK